MLEHPDGPVGTWSFHTLLQVDLVKAQRRYPSFRRLKADMRLKFPDRRKIRKHLRVVHQVSEGDERVGLAATIVDGELAIRLVALPRQADTDVLDQLAQIVGRVGEREELCRVLVHRPPAFLHDHVVQVGGEYGQRQLARPQVVAQLHDLVPGFPGRFGCHVVLIE